MRASDSAHLFAYRRALQIAARLEGVARQIPPERRDMQDQLRRATASIVLNLAEGAGEFKSAEKVRFYRMARRSATECIAVLDLLPVMTRQESGTARSEVNDFVGLVTRLILGVENRS